jgi:hypothetical protein
LGQSFAQLDQVAVEVAGNAFDRQLVDLVDDALEFFLQLLEVAGNGWNADRAQAGVKFDLLGFRVEVQRDV